MRPERSLTFWAMSVAAGCRDFPFITTADQLFPHSSEFLLPGTWSCRCLRPALWVFGSSAEFYLVVLGRACYSFRDDGAMFALSLRPRSRQLRDSWAHSPHAALLHLGFACHFFTGLWTHFVPVGHSRLLLVVTPHLILSILGFVSCATWAVYARVGLHKADLKLPNPQPSRTGCAYLCLRLTRLVMHMVAHRTVMDAGSC